MGNRKVFIVGSHPDVVFGSLKQHLDQHNISIVGHHDYDSRKQLSPIPAEADGVLIMIDMISHALAWAAEDAAKKRNLPYAKISRKWVKTEKMLRKTGFISDVKPPLEALVVEITREAMLAPVMDILRSQPKLIINRDLLLPKVREKFPQADEKLVQTVVTDSVAQVRTEWADPAKRREPMMSFIKSLYSHFVAHPDSGWPSVSTTIKDELIKIFGVADNPVRLARQARVEVFGEWAQDLNFVGKIIADPVNVRGTPYMVDHARSLYPLLEKDLIKGICSTTNWMTSKKAIEDYLNQLLEIPSWLRPVGKKPAVPNLVSEEKPSPKEEKQNTVKLVEVLVQKALEPIHKKLEDIFDQILGTEGKLKGLGNLGDAARNGVTLHGITVTIESITINPSK